MPLPVNSFSDEQFDEMMAAARKHCVSGNIDAGIALLNESIEKLESEDFVNHSLLGYVYAEISTFYLMQRKFTTAIAQLEEGVAKHPHCNSLKLDLVRVAKLSGDWSDQRLLERLFTLEPPLKGYDQIMFGYIVRSIESDGCSNEVDQLKAFVLLGVEINEP